MRKLFIFLSVILASNFASALIPDAEHEVYINGYLWTNRALAVGHTWHKFTDEEVAQAEEDEDTEKAVREQICRSRPWRRMPKNQILLSTQVEARSCGCEYYTLSNSHTHFQMVQISDKDFLDPDLQKLESIKVRFSKTIESVRKVFGLSKVEVRSLWIDRSQEKDKNGMRPAQLIFKVEHPVTKKISKIMVRSEVKDSGNEKDIRDDLKLLQLKLLERYPMFATIFLPKKEKCKQDPKQNCFQYGYSLEE